MSALFAWYVIGWAAMFSLASLAIYATFGNAMLVSMFPEGRRWWMPWSRLASLAAFAAVVLMHPFGGSP